MDIKEIKQKRDELTDKISHLIADFEVKTETNIDRINIEKVVIDDGTMRIIKIDMPLLIN